MPSNRSKQQVHLTAVTFSLLFAPFRGRFQALETKG